MLTLELRDLQIPIKTSAFRPNFFNSTSIFFFQRSLTSYSKPPVSTYQTLLPLSKDSSSTLQSLGQNSCEANDTTENSLRTGLQFPFSHLSTLFFFAKSSNLTLLKSYHNLPLLRNRESRTLLNYSNLKPQNVVLHSSIALNVDTFRRNGRSSPDASQADMDPSRQRPSTCGHASVSPASPTN